MIGITYPKEIPKIKLIELLLYKLTKSIETKSIKIDWAPVINSTLLGNSSDWKIDLTILNNPIDVARNIIFFLGKIIGNWKVDVIITITVIDMTPKIKPLKMWLMICDLSLNVEPYLKIDWFNQPKERAAIRFVNEKIILYLPYSIIPTILINKIVESNPTIPGIILETT